MVARCIEVTRDFRVILWYTFILNKLIPTCVGEGMMYSLNASGNWVSHISHNSRLPRGAHLNFNPSELFGGSDKLIEANDLNGMGAVLEKRGEFNQAQRCYEQALALFEDIFGSEHLTTALVSRNLARVLREQGESAEAVVLEDMAAAILRRRGDDSVAHETPFGGSSGFFHLLGWQRDAATAQEIDLAAQPDQPSAAFPGQSAGSTTAGAHP
jgi:tetratricopeptide (TPR) repeat protein